ncbi:MAG: hypothetical protein KAJ29_04440 [Alphaproteobacteria bacterium]|nr:hypothetical protein [Alphaproteobacteria bacterium]
MSPLYEITKTVADDWNNIATYTIRNEGEETMRSLYKAFDQSIKEMVNEDGDFIHYISLYNQEVPVIHCRDYFIFGVTRENKPLLIFAILHKDTDLMQRLTKQYNFFEKPYNHCEYIEKMRNQIITQADYDLLTGDE